MGHEKGLAARAAGKAFDKALNRVIGSLDEKDRRAAEERVEALAKKYPDMSTEERVERLIKRKCRRTAAVGAVTAAPANIPGLGTVTSLLFGSTVDLALTIGMQAELVLEIAACMDIDMTETEERTALMLITGFGSGTTQLAKQVGKQVAAKAGEQLAKKSVARSLPVIGMGASAGVNMVTTYFIGRRAAAYFSLGEERMEDWGETARKISGVDERKLVGWMSDTAERSWDLVGRSASDAKGKLITVGKSTGDLIVTTGRGIVGRVGKLGRNLRGLPASAEETQASENSEALTTE